MWWWLRWRRNICRLGSRVSKFCVERLSVTLDDYEIISDNRFCSFCLSGPVHDLAGPREIHPQTRIPAQRLGKRNEYGGRAPFSYLGSTRKTKKKELLGSRRSPHSLFLDGGSP